MQATHSLLIGFTLFIVGGLLILTMQPLLFALGIATLVAGVLVPLAEMILKGSRSSKSNTVESTASEGQPAVLIVEDQANWRNTLQLALQDQYFVRSAASLSEARTILFERRQPFHVVVVDIRLDDADPSNEDGLMLTEEIQTRLDGFSTVIAITAYPSVSSVKRAIQRGVFEYVEKYPEDGSRFDIHAFRRAIQRAIRIAAKYRGEVSPRVLIIEDEKNWQQALTTMLEGESFEVEIADTYQEAESRIREQVYDLFVVDLRLGDVSPDRGMELLNRIEELGKGAKAIIVTGFGTPQRIRSAFADHRSLLEDFFLKAEFDRRLFLDTARRAISSQLLHFQVRSQDGPKTFNTGGG